jgi:ferredoxin-NADP reductase
VDDLEVGDSLSLDGPYGDFSFLGEHDKVCMLSGGIGVTPLLSMIKFCTDKKTSTDISLLYSNRNEDEIPFKDDLKQMQRTNLQLEVNMTITNPSSAWRGLSGRVNGEMIRSTVPQWAERIYYVSGPQPMVESMTTLLEEMGLDPSQIKHEYFSGYKGPNAGEELVG